VTGKLRITGSRKHKYWARGTGERRGGGRGQEVLLGKKKTLTLVTKGGGGLGQNGGLNTTRANNKKEKKVKGERGKKRNKSGWKVGGGEEGSAKIEFLHDGR